MDLIQFKAQIEASQSRKWTPRQKHLDALDRALYGELYKHIQSSFSREFADRGNTKRISLDDRRASVQYQLAMMIARDLSTRLFGESGRPALLARYDDYTNAWISALIEDSFLWWTYIDATWQGSVGSVCIVTRILAEDKEDGQFFHEVWPAVECSPVFKRNNPTKLQQLTRTYFSKSDMLRAEGYDVDALEEEWRKKKLGSGRGKLQAKYMNAANVASQASPEWVMRCVLDTQAETWKEPIPKWLYELDEFDEKTEWRDDPDRTESHNLGEVPAVWIRALPSRHTKFPDGGSTFEPVIDFQFRIDRTLSQTGRAFDYVGDPQLALKAGSTGSSDFGEDMATPDATASDVVMVEPEGDASFLEIRGEGLQVAIDTYVAALRRIAREVGAASRIDPEAAPREMSGVAMRMLEHALFGVVGILRISTGDMGLIPHIRLCMRMANKVRVSLPSLNDKLKSGDPDVEPIASKGAPDPNASIESQWPPTPEPSGADKLAEVQAATLAASTATGPPGISQQTLVANLAPLYDVRDPVKEFASISSQMEEKQQNDLDVADKQAAIEAKHNPKPVMGK